MKKIEYLVNESIKTYINNIIKESVYNEKVNSVEELFSLTNEQREDIIIRMRQAVDAMNSLFNRILSVAKHLHEEIVEKYSIQPNQISCSIYLDEYKIQYVINGSENWTEEEYGDHETEISDMLYPFISRTEYTDLQLKDYFNLQLSPIDGNVLKTGSEYGYPGAMVIMSWDIHDIINDD